MTAHGRSRACASLVAALAILQVPDLHAQAPTTLNGVVTDTSGVPLTGVTVSVTGTAVASTTDERGEFRISGVGPGTVEIRARRLGFSPGSINASVELRESHDQLYLQLVPLPTTLKPIVVQTSRGERGGGRLADYYDRLHRRAAGQFITRAEIDRQQHMTLSQLIARAPGVSTAQLRGGASVRMRGMACRPLVWIDGTALPAGEVDLDVFPVSSLHGIELYLGASTAPLTHTAVRGQSSCGTILLWSRGRDTDPPDRPRRGIDLESLIAASAVYTAEHVDRPAQLDTAHALDVTYPPDMYASGVGGSVVAEFVVSARGRIEPNTVSIVSSTHPMFIAAVMRSLQGAVYVPALRGALEVRQVVQQPFGFHAGNRKISTRSSR